MKSYKIIVGLLISLFVFGSTFAYDLTDKEKAKGDKIAQKVLLLISKKEEDKQAKFKEKIIVQLEGVYEKTRKNEKIQALVGYVIEKVKSGVNPEPSRYPGCDTDDIVLSNGQVWSACDVGSSTQLKNGKIFAYGSILGYPADTKTPPEERVGTGIYWSEKDPQGPCENGYHIPSKRDVELVDRIEGQKDIFGYESEQQTYSMNLKWIVNEEGGNRLGMSVKKSLVGHEAKFLAFQSIRCIKD